mmetsp:Transcript_25385/g.83463  ORF Transcript_25385/g.83463 Transcript_25385/m.83463 type:complete len:240 (+) Transcript_25385:623-1342(+)
MSQAGRRHRPAKLAAAAAGVGAVERLAARAGSRAKAVRLEANPHSQRIRLLGRCPAGRCGTPPRQAVPQPHRTRHPPLRKFRQSGSRLAAAGTPRRRRRRSSCSSTSPRRREPHHRGTGTHTRRRHASGSSSFESRPRRPRHTQSSGFRRRSSLDTKLRTSRQTSPPHRRSANCHPKRRTPRARRTPPRVRRTGFPRTWVRSTAARRCTPLQQPGCRRQGMRRCIDRAHRSEPSCTRCP